MKKLRMFSIILLVVSATAYFGFQVYSKVTRDNTPPVVTCDSEELRVSVSQPEEDLLKGVKAVDDRSGDVKDTLVIEEISDFTEEGTRIITYAAVDESKNVGRMERTLVYEDYQAPVFDMSNGLCFTAGSNVDILGRISAESVIDGDLTSKIKYSLEKSINASEPGNYPVQFRVMDSAGKTVYLNTVVEICDREYAGIDVYLSDYLIYLEKGQEFSPWEYYQGTDREADLAVDSKVDTTKEGTYYVDYIASAGTLKGKNWLVVVVE